MCPFFVGGEGYVLGEVEKVEYIQEFCGGFGVSRVGRVTDVEVTKEQNGWGDGTKLCEKFRQIRGESRVRFGGAVNDCSNQGLGTRQFKSKVFKSGGGRDGYCSCNDV